MKKKVLLAMMMGMVTLAIGCGVPTQQDLDAEAIRQGERLKDSIDSIQDEYKDYVDDMGIDVNELLDKVD